MTTEQPLKTYLLSVTFEEPFGIGHIEKIANFWHEYYGKPEPPHMSFNVPARSYDVLVVARDMDTVLTVLLNENNFNYRKPEAIFCRRIFTHEIKDQT